MKSWKQILKESFIDFLSMVRIIMVGAFIIAIIIANSSVEQTQLIFDIFNSDRTLLKGLIMLGLFVIIYISDVIIEGIVKIIWFLLKAFKNKIWK